MSLPIRMPVEDESHVAEARRIAAAKALEIGFSPDRVGQVSIIMAELATNLLKHAGRGELIVRGLVPPDSPGLEILSLDRGPGMVNTGEALRDGYSTTGSPGTGLGAVQRLSSLFDLYSKAGRGAAVLSRIRRETDLRPPIGVPFEVGAVCLPLEGESLCGDAWAAHRSPERALIMVADGLGHGEYAAEASGEALRIFQGHPEDSPAFMIERLHKALQGTRGAAVSVTELSRNTRLIRYCGLGNISARVLSAQGDYSLVSSNGTTGLGACKIREFTYPWPEGGLLVMHSDGLSSRWKLDEYPGLRQRHPALMAAVLFRDFAKPRDDSSLVVVSDGRGAP